MGRRIPIHIVALVVALAAVLVAACSGGPVRRISEPATSIQQLTVQADGSWSINLRLQNYSSVPMRFEAVDLALSVGGEEGGTLAHRPGLEIGPTSADVVTIDIQPTPGARMLIADALAGGRGVDYRIEGTIDAAPTDRGASRSYTVERRSALSPAPGLPGVLR